MIQTGKTVILRKRYVPSFQVLFILFLSKLTDLTLFHPTETPKGPEIQLWARGQKYVLPDWKIRKVK